MKHLLIAGNVTSLAPFLCQRLSQQYHPVVVAQETPPQAFGKGADVFAVSGEDGFASVFRTYQFCGMLFLGTRSEQRQGPADEENMLRHALSMADRHDIQRIIYLSSFELSRETAYGDELPILLRAREQLCAVYRQKGRNVVCVRLPYVFGAGETDTFIGRLMRDAARGDELTLPLGGEEELNFISAEDVAALVRLLLEEDVQPPEGCLSVCGGETMTAADLCAKLNVLGVKVSLAARSTGRYACPPMDGSLLRRSHGYLAVDSLSPQLQTLFLGARESLVKPPARRARLLAFLRRHAGWVKAVELILGYGIMELLNAHFGTAGQFRFVDFRLLYVVLMGSTHGLQTGLIASTLACFSAARGYAALGLNAQAILYNVVNWLPFASLVLLGSATGYIRDKRHQEGTFVSDSLRAMEKRYTNLQNLYQQALKSKDQLKDQVISYRDSFGRIYAITSRLNVLNPEAVFAQAIPVLEEALDNQSVAIYTIGSGAEYARLNISSKGLNGSVPPSLQLSKFQPMMDELKEQGVFCNRRLQEGLPFYCAPILSARGNSAGLVMVWEAYPSQMTLYYQNLFKVLCQMVHDSLMRAIAYEEALWETKHFPGTFVLLPEHFRQALLLKEQMRDEQMLDFKLLRLDAAQIGLQEFSNTVAPRIRHVDLLGQDFDGAYYLILMQAQAQGAQIVLERLAQVSISCRLLGPGEMKKLLANPPQQKAAPAEAKAGARGERPQQTALKPVEGPLMPLHREPAGNQRAEQERIAHLRKERERLDQMHQEQLRLEEKRQQQLRREAQRAEQAKLELKRQERARAEQMRKDQKQLMQWQLEQRRLEQERLDQIRREQERLTQLWLEQEKLEHQRQEQERLDQIRREQERLAQLRLEQEKLEHQRQEQERLDQIRREQERLAQLRLEQEKLERQRQEQERLDQIRREQERQEQLRLEQERLAQQRQKQQQVEQLRLMQQQLMQKHQAQQQEAQQRLMQMGAEIRRLELSLNAPVKEQASFMPPPNPPAEMKPQDERAAQAQPPDTAAEWTADQQLMKIQSEEQARFARQRAELDRLNQQRQRGFWDSALKPGASPAASAGPQQIPTPQVASFKEERQGLQSPAASRREKVGRRTAERRGKLGARSKDKPREEPLREPDKNWAGRGWSRADGTQGLSALPLKPELHIVPGPAKRRS